ncbi:MAG TPA: amidohydrolase family protein [Stellaceae bacterium]|nr:amidohydrolase family protein [Stellaceae bacterium]
MVQIVDIHTHCSVPDRSDPLGVGAFMRGTAVGRNSYNDFRGLPSISYYELTDFDLQQEVSHKAGIARRLMSNPFGAEVLVALSKKSAGDVIKHNNDQIAALVERSKGTTWGLGVANPLDASLVKDAEKCMTEMRFKGLMINSSWQGKFIDTEESFPFWEWAEAQQVPLFLHPVRVPIGHEQQMDQYKLDELVGRPFDTAMCLARMILSGLFDRYPRLKIVVAHMGGGLLPVMGRLNFGWRLGSDGMPDRAKIKCQRLPSDYLRAHLHVDTMGIWGPHLREAVEVFGPDRVMFGTDYGPVPIDPKEHIDLVEELALTPAEKEKIYWKNANAFFDLGMSA